MRRWTDAIVGAGIALTVLYGVVRGFDLVALVILAAIVGVGLLAMAAARKSERRSVIPARCRACGGLISRHAPYCKHCGAPAGSR